MSDTQGFTSAPPIPVADASVDVRFEFMRRTYGLLMGGIGAFVALEVFLFTTGLAEPIFELVASTSWLLVLGGFVLVSWIANTLAFKAETRTSQLGAYGLLIVAEALLFVAPLYIATTADGMEGVLGKAAAVTVVGFVGLSGIAITSSKDFSFLGAILKWVGFAAIGLIVLALITGFSLGTWFSVAMIAFAGGAILWDTQRILRDYPQGTEVLAAMQLFASVALLFWYVLRLFMARD